MKKSWGLTEKILSGEKRIESRWYLARRAPWDRIKAGETIYFKNSGEPVTIKAIVEKVMQFENLNPKKVKEILEQYGKDIFGISWRLGSNQQYRPTFDPRLFARESSGGCIADLPNTRLWTLDQFLNKKYCLLVFLKNPVKIKPFQIDKTGFGMMSAWISVKNINQIKK